MKHENTSRLIKRVRVKISDGPQQFAGFVHMVEELGGVFGEIKTVHVGNNYRVKEIDTLVPDEETFDTICDAIRKTEAFGLVGVTDVVQEVHRGGKIEVRSRVDVENLDDLRIVYTPGVASVCRKIQRNPELAYELTTISSNVAIVTNGTAILGLGDIGPVAGMPVMEGKALLFRELAGVNGFPILIDSKDPDRIVQTIEAIAPTFGAIKLEDIKAPECFEIEERLDQLLDIPVVHDDQHGTAIVVLAAVLNIAERTYINLARSTVGIVGLGAAGSGIASLLKAFGVEKIYGADIDERMVRRFADRGGEPTDLEGVMQKARIVIATTGVPGLIKPEMVQSKQVVLALSNPDPEITPAVATGHGAIFAADGKSVNNALAFPGLFRGALRARAKRVNSAMKIAAAKTIAAHSLPDDLVPNILRREVHEAVSAAVETAALRTGVVRFRRETDPAAGK